MFVETTSATRKKRANVDEKNASTTMLNNATTIASQAFFVRLAFSLGRKNLTRTAAIEQA